MIEFTALIWARHTRSDCTTEVGSRLDIVKDMHTTSAKLEKRKLATLKNLPSEEKSVRFKHQRNRQGSRPHGVYLGRSSPLYRVEAGASNAAGNCTVSDRMVRTCQTEEDRSEGPRHAVACTSARTTAGEVLFVGGVKTSASSQWYQEQKTHSARRWWA